ncbi:MAG: hypothetical protein GY719_24100, partial [bacterium]|nr:hypothetical protein [bacterium]
FTSGTAVTAEGDYTLEVTASDVAGNSSTETRTFTIDKTDPAITISGVSDGEVSNFVVTPVIEVTDLHLGPVTITLDGQPFVGGTAVDVLGTHTLAVTAEDLCGNSSAETITFTVDQCEIYPIAVHEDSLAGVSGGDEIVDIFNGTQPGNFGWLTWTGATNVPTTVGSLTPPGDSDTYTNPADPSDRVISIGDLVQGGTGVQNAAPIRDALDLLKTVDIVVPVWDVTQGSGANSTYRVVDFIQVRLIDYQLSEENRITVRYLGPAACADEP